MGLIACLPILLSASAVEASAATRVRLLHAFPGGPRATLELSAGGRPGATIEGVGFGQASRYAAASVGRVTLTLRADGDEVGRTTATLRDGSYTVVAARSEEVGASLRVVPDGSATAGQARIRVVHAAAEIDRADFALGDRMLGRLAAGRTGEYVTVEPGGYTVAARRPGSGNAIVEQPTSSLAAGTASTAYLIGSGGERTRFVVVEDSTAGPGRAPATGLGGLSGEDAPWAMVLLAALVAGALGGAAYIRAAARGGRARS